MISLTRGLWATGDSTDHCKHLLFLCLLSCCFESARILGFTIRANGLDSTRWYHIGITLASTSQILSLSWRWMLNLLGLSETWILVGLIEEAVVIRVATCTNESVCHRRMHHVLILHRVIVLLIKAKTSVNSSISLAVSWMLHNSAHNLFLILEWVHIHRLGDITFMMLTTRMLCLLSFYAVSSSLQSNWRPIVSRVQLDYWVVNFYRIKEGIVDFLCRRLMPRVRRRSTCGLF